MGTEGRPQVRPICSILEHTEAMDTGQLSASQAQVELSLLLCVVLKTRPQFFYNVNFVHYTVPRGLSLGKMLTA
jgi:hypothetical protein